MHTFTKKSTCFLMTAIAAAIATSPVAVLAAGPLVLTNVVPPSAPLAPSTTWGKTVLPANNMKGATAVQLSSSDVLHITVALKLQNKDDLDNFLKTQATSATPQWLSSADSTKNYSPTQTQAQGVADYLTSAGFTNVKISGTRLFVTADGTAPVVQKAFNTTLGKYSVNGTVGILNTQAVQVPAALNEIVHAVTGLNTFRRAHTHILPARSASLSKPVPKLNVGGFDIGNAYWPDEFATVYHAGTAPTGNKVDVAIIGWCSMNNAQNGLNQMIKDRGLPAVATSIVEVSAPNCNALENSNGEGEWAMDAQAIVGISGGVKSLTFYTVANSSADIGAAVDRVVSDNKARIINMSWSIGAEDGSEPYDQAFLLGKTQGQLFVNSSGDNGSYPCANDGSAANICNSMTEAENGSQGDPKKPWINYPTSSPYVITVGGTTLTTDANKGYISETAWADSGGGVSQFVAIPDWQKGIVTGNFRAVPDVAFDGDPNTGMHYFMTTYSYLNSGYDAKKSTENSYVTVSIDGAGKLYLDPANQDYKNQHYLVALNFNGYVNNAGTSLSAPLATGSWARLQSKANGQLPFAPLIIYGLASKAGGAQGTALGAKYATGVHDVTSGNNGGYTAGLGWDNVTGWGSADIQNLIDHTSRQEIMKYINK